MDGSNDYKKMENLIKELAQLVLFKDNNTSEPTIQISEDRWIRICATVSALDKLSRYPDVENPKNRKYTVESLFCRTYRGLEGTIVDFNHFNEIKYENNNMIGDGRILRSGYNREDGKTIYACNVFNHLTNEYENFYEQMIGKYPTDQEYVASCQKYF